MRTNIVINEELMAKAMILSKLKTKKEIVEQALQEFVEARSKKDLSDLFGQDLLDENYDYKTLRRIAD